MTKFEKFNNIPDNIDTFSIHSLDNDTEILTFWLQ